MNYLYRHIYYINNVGKLCEVISFFPPFLPRLLWHVYLKHVFAELPRNFVPGFSTINQAVGIKFETRFAYNIPFSTFDRSVEKFTMYFKLKSEYVYVSGMPAIFPSGKRCGII